MSLCHLTPSLIVALIFQLGCGSISWQRVFALSSSMALASVFMRWFTIMPFNRTLVAKHILLFQTRDSELGRNRTFNNISNIRCRSPRTNRTPNSLPPLHHIHQPRARPRGSRLIVSVQLPQSRPPHPLRTSPPTTQNSRSSPSPSPSLASPSTNAFAPSSCPELHSSRS